MADNKTTITITARDETRAALDRINKGLSGLTAAASRLPVLGTALAGAFSGAALTAGIKSIIDGADELNKASQKYGVAVEQLSALKYAGALADVSLEAIGNGLKKLSVNMLDTAAGTGDAKDAFKALGISVTEVGGGLKSSDQVFGEIADKFAGMEDGAGKTALAVKLFGRAGAEMIPLLNAGSRGLADMKAEAEALGVIVGGDLARKSEEFNDNLTRLGAAFDAIKISLAQSVLPALSQFVEQLVVGIKAAGGFWEALENLGTINPFKNHQENIRAYAEDLEKIERRLQFAIGGGERASLEKDAAVMRQRIAYLKEIAALQANAGGGQGRLDAKDIGPKTLSKAPALPADDKKKKVDDEIVQMRELGKEYEKLWENADKYVAGLDAQIAKGGALTQSEQQLLEIERLLPPEWAASIRPLLERADALEKQKKQMEEGKKLYQETRTDMENLAATESHLAELLDAGAITWDTYARAVFDAQDKIKESKQPLDEMTEFVKQAARNMQDAMADGFFNIMQGKFDDLAGNFKQTIDRMVANLLASQLMNYLTGDFGRTGKMGGALGSLFSSLLPSYDVGTDFVPRTGPALIHRGERIVPAAENRAGGVGVTVVNNFTLSQPADRRTQEQIAALAGASIQTAMARGA